MVDLVFSSLPVSLVTEAEHRPRDDSNVPAFLRNMVRSSFPAPTPPASSEQNGAGIELSALGASTSELTSTVSPISAPHVTCEDMESKHDEKSEPVSVRSNL